MHLHRFMRHSLDFSLPSSSANSCFKDAQEKMRSQIIPLLRDFHYTCLPVSTFVQQTRKQPQTTPPSPQRVLVDFCHESISRSIVRIPIATLPVVDCQELQRKGKCTQRSTSVTRSRTSIDDATVPCSHFLY